MRCKKCGGRVASLVEVRLKAVTGETRLAERSFQCRDCGWRGFEKRRKPFADDAVAVNSLFTNCPLCGRPVVLGESTLVYNADYGKLWICSDYPKCDACVGCHKGSAVPMGTPAGAELRLWRNKAHAALDPLWKEGPYDRREIYARLASELKIPPRKCHVAMMDGPLCRRTIEVCSGLLKKEGR